LVLEYDTDGVVGFVGRLSTGEVAGSSQQEDGNSGVMHCGWLFWFMRVSGLELVQRGIINE
jgi:hypothetical protein